MPSIRVSKSWRVKHTPAQARDDPLAEDAPRSCPLECCAEEAPARWVGQLLQECVPPPQFRRSAALCETSARKFNKLRQPTSWLARDAPILIGVALFRRAIQLFPSRGEVAAMQLRRDALPLVAAEGSLLSLAVGE